MAGAGSRAAGERQGEAVRGRESDGSDGRGRGRGRDCLAGYSWLDFDRFWHVLFFFSLSFMFSFILPPQALRGMLFLVRVVIACLFVFAIRYSRPIHAPRHSSLCRATEPRYEPRSGSVCADLAAFFLFFGLNYVCPIYLDGGALTLQTRLKPSDLELIRRLLRSKNI